MRVLLVGSLVLLLSACSAAPTMVPGVSPAPSSTASAAAPVALAVAPAKETDNLPISAEIGLTVSNGTVESVVVTDASGAAVAGKLREDSTSWVPDAPLKFATGYTATVTAKGSDGKSVTESTSFKTMAKPSKRNGIGLYLFADRTYGVAQPVVVEFSNPVPESARASVQSRLFVTTTPPQPGVWHWSSPKQVMYRAKDYWQPGTKIEARIALEGHPMGDGRYGDADRRGVGNISTEKIELIVDNATKEMNVLRNGESIKTLKVSLGKAATPSSSGTLVIMDKLTKTIFDTTNEPGDVDRYKVEIQYAQRLTWSGEFIHAAPWSVKDQGVRNVSHGCVNVSMADAQWLFNITRLGDPVTIKGTERKVVPGNGFTAWALPWDEYVKGSAIPVA
ncbi:L,D-transpeptidase [Rhizocola hellebori]|nr:Ig-like domain-containing protein [Rhizocola hellebori]